MTVRDILAQVAKIAEGESLQVSIQNQEEKTDEGVKSKVDSLLSCYNAIVREIALNYYEYLKTKEVPQNTILIESFDLPLLKIVSVVDKQGNSLRYKYENGKVVAEKYPFTINYRTLPKAQELAETFVYDKTPIGENVVIYGVLAEYMLIQNRIEEALNWENKFRQSLDFRIDYKARKLKAGKRWGL